MRTLATGQRSDTARSGAGFSLIEILVVTAILASVSLAAVLSFRLAPRETPAARVEDFARAIRFLREEAMYTRRNFAVSFAHGSWRVLELEERSGQWRPRDDTRPYHAGAWDRDFEASLEIEDVRVVIRNREQRIPEPDVMLLSSGESTPFRLTLEDGAGRTAGCRLGAFGELECWRGS